MTNQANDQSESPYKSYTSLSESERLDFQRQAFATINKMAMKEISKISKTSSFLSKFKIEDISKFLQNPAQYEKQLRNLSQYLYNVSPQYRRLILYMALMPIYAYTVEPLEIPDKIDKEKFKKQYKKILMQIEKMNIKHEFSKVSKVGFREDFYFGYVHETKDSFFLQKLNPDYCRISSIEDGVFNFAYDFSYFDSNLDLLKSFPIEFQEKHSIYKNRGNDYRMQELSSDTSICIKINDDILEYGIPPFNTVFEAIFDHDEYKRLKKSRTKADNFMTLIQRIPMDEKNPDINKFLIDLDTANSFHQMANEALPDNIGLITSPMPIEAVRMDQARNAADTTAQALREIYNDSGISQHIFNSDKSTSTGLAKSIIADEQISLGFLRQVERWINRRIKNMSGIYKFHFKFLDVTVFNQDEMFDRYLKAAQSGLPVISEAAATIGVSPLDLLNKATLENDILGLHDILRPLATSHTQSSKDSPSSGAPKKRDDQISDSGQINRDANTDENKE